MEVAVTNGLKLFGRRNLANKHADLGQISF